jgi:hypothetical protein
MRRHKVKRVLVDYSEDLLGATTRRAVEEHLSECEQCRSELARIESVKKEILSLEAPEPDTRFWRQFDAKLSRRLDREVGEERAVAIGRGSLWRFGIPLAATGVVALALGLFLIFSGNEPNPENPQQRAGEIVTAGAIEQPTSELSEDEVFIEMLLAENGFSGGDIEQDSEELYALIEEDLIDEPDEIILSDIYEETIYDFIEGLSEEELEDVYDGLASI